jgi:hypothetical protein
MIWLICDAAVCDPPADEILSKEQPYAANCMVYRIWPSSILQQNAYHAHPVIDPEVHNAHPVAHALLHLFEG